MILSLARDELIRYVKAQVRTFFPDGAADCRIEKHMDECLDRVEYCFAAVHDGYFKVGGSTVFNHLNSDQYSMFLYFLSNTMLRNHVELGQCEKVFLLNKLLTGISVYPTTQLPDIFLFAHALGTVLGRAKYSNYLLVYQGCTVGSNHDVDYPTLGEHVALYKNAAILGRCNVGENCKIAADSTVMDLDLEANSIYIGRPSEYRIRRNRHNDRIWDADSRTSSSTAESIGGHVDPVDETKQRKGAANDAMQPVPDGRDEAGPDIG